ncbi:MAG: hypothetical protein LT070_01680 [Solirubrobacteraceae bacterium]|nr:hypothetical protein [Solirubrobacteraceae bacterium]
MTTPPASTTADTAGPAAADDPSAGLSPARRIAARAAALHWPAILLGLLVVGVVVGTVAYPTYTNYDSTYSLIWGRELLHGELPSFDAYRAPTQHPLALVFGAALALLGDAADRLMVIATLASFVVLVVGLYRLARTAFTVPVGLAAGAILCTRLDFPFLAARAYIDIPYLALVIWAAVVEARSPRRRGLLVLALLALAGLLRPEAWLLSGLYWLYFVMRASWRERIVGALIVAAAPLVWVLTDLAVTGDPLFSLTHTSGLAEELGRQKGISEVPSAMVGFLRELVKLPIAFAGAIGLVLAAWIAPTRLRVPVALFAVGLGTFLLVGVAGLSVINRYLLVPSMMVMLFAAFAIAGFSLLRERSAVRRAWALAAAVLVAGAALWTALKVNPNRLTGELVFRGDSRPALAALLRSDAVRRHASCGPVTVPNHKLIPDVRWIADLPVDRVIARSDARAMRGVDSGVAIFAARRSVLVRQGLTPEDSSPQDTARSLPPPSFSRIATNGFYTAYGRCP